jgi:hypothetical protein
LSEATVVALYLPPEVLTELRPVLSRLRPGARIVSHQFEIPDRPFERSRAVESAEDGQAHNLYLWRVR